MKSMVVCSIFDSAISAFLTPFMCDRTGQAIREFSDAVNGKIDGADNYKNHYADYSLYQIGTWSDDTGEIVALDAPLLLIAGPQARVPDSVNTGDEFVGRDVSKRRKASGVQDVAA